MLPLTIKITVLTMSGSVASVTAKLLLPPLFLLYASAWTQPSASAAALSSRNAETVTLAPLLYTVEKRDSSTDNTCPFL